MRIDSGDPRVGARNAIKWWRSMGENPREKLIIFSDGLDVGQIVDLHKEFSADVNVSFGWGTNLTNDFRNLVDGSRLDAFSLVCKAATVNGRATVKLSDNPNKVTGPCSEIDRYRRVFQVGPQEASRIDI